jgi:sorting nexin-29
MEKCYEYNIDLDILFNDFRQAFYSIDINQLFKALKSYGIPEKIMKLIMMILNDNIAKVLMADASSRSLNILTGVRQGDALSAAVFNIALKMVLGGTVEKGNIIYKSIEICAYSDDIVVIARNTTALKEVILSLDFEGKKWD